MEVKAKELDSVNAEASLKIDSQSLKSELDKVAQKASKNIKMDGFRPGKVPASAVLKRYEKELSAEAEQNLFKQAIDTALKELKKDAKELVGEPYFEKFEKNDQGIEAELVLSFKPKIDLKGYESLIPAVPEIKVSKKEIDEKKEALLKNYAKNEPIKEKRGLENGDFANFDFEGFVDGKAFEGGKAEKFTLEIGSKQFIPGFEDAMLGMKAGEQKDIEVIFPKDYGAKELASKEAVFKIKLHEILKPVMPKLDNDLLKKLLPESKEPSEAELDEKIKKQIENEKRFKLINDELKAKFADALIAKFNFDLPRGVVEQETDIQFQNSLSGLNADELKELQNDKDKAKAKRESFKDEAQKSVKLTFIINELATLRKLGVSDQEVMQAVYFEAYRNGFDPKALLQDYQRNGLLPAVKMAILEEKLFNDIFVPKVETAAQKTSKKSAADEKTATKTDEKSSAKEDEKATKKSKASQKESE